MLYRYYNYSKTTNCIVGWLCWGLTSQSTIFQSCRDGAIASWVINQYFRGVKCLAQGHNTAAVGLEPRTSRSGVRHSTTEPPRSPQLYCVHSPDWWVPFLSNAVGAPIFSNVVLWTRIAFFKKKLVTVLWLIESDQLSGEMQSSNITKQDIVMNSIELKKRVCTLHFSFAI